MSSASSADNSATPSLSQFLEKLRSGSEVERQPLIEQISALTATSETKAQFAELVRKGGDESILGVQPLMRLGEEGAEELLDVIDTREDDAEYFDRITTEAGFELSEENRTYLNKMVLEQNSDAAQEILRKADLIESEKIYGEPD